MAHVTRPTAHFSPHGGCTEAIVAAIGEARQSVRFLAYSFTSAAIADALIAAHKRGVDVRGVVDARMAHGRGEQAHRMKSTGVEVAADDKHPISHNKTYIIDYEHVITGSFNASEQAEANGENVLIIGDKVLAAAYVMDWVRHHAHAIELPPPTVGAAPWPPVAVEPAEQGYGFQVAVGGSRVGPALTRDAAALVAQWLAGGALPDLAGALCPGGAEGSDEA